MRVFDKFLDEFIPASKLREYLKNEPISDKNMADIIFYAIAPVEKKAEALYELEHMELPEERRFFREHWLKYRKSINAALELRTAQNAIFIVYEQAVCGDNVDSDECMLGIFSSYEAAKNFLIKDAEQKKNEEGVLNWYEINLWVKDVNSSYIDTCTYYFIDGELCYTEFDLGNDLHESCTDGELNIPVPYKPGDILISDRYPFGRKEKFVMLQIGDNHDCCCLQALFKNAKGSWNVGAVKHGMMGSVGYPRVSVLYIANEYEPDLSSPEDAILAKVSKLIDGDEKKGSIIWDRLCFENIQSDDDIMKILDEVDFYVFENGVT